MNHLEVLQPHLDEEVEDERQLEARLWPKFSDGRRTDVWRGVLSPRKKYATHESDKKHTAYISINLNKASAING